MELSSLAEKALATAKRMGSDQTMVVVSSTEANEFNVEANRMTLLRTTFDQNLTIQTNSNQRQAKARGNQFTDAAIEETAQSAISASQASEADPHHGFAPSFGVQKFSFGSLVPDLGWAQTQLNQLLKDREEHFPKVIIEGSLIKFVKTEKVLATSNGSFFKSQQGHYEGFVMFTAKEGKKSSSFNAIDFKLAAENVGSHPSLMQTAQLRELFRQASEQTEVRKVPAKFEGEVILTPHCLDGFINEVGSFLSSDRMLKKSSFFENKLNQKVASEKWNLSSQPVDSNFATRKFWTSDAYLTENENFLENGVLKKYLLNHYASQKLKQSVSRSEGGYWKLRAGDQKLKTMIAAVKRGVLMCRYSAGSPAENGDVSGVAKNSYYIENGEIQYPLSETMISGNISRMLNDLVDMSQETVSNGIWDLPWVRIGGVRIS